MLGVLSNTWRRRRDSVLTGPVQSSYRARCAPVGDSAESFAQYTQTFLIPRGNCSSSFLVSSVHSLRSFTADALEFGLFSVKPSKVNF